MKGKQKEVLYISEKGEVLSPLSREILAVSNPRFSWQELVRHIPRIKVKRSQWVVCIISPKRGSYVVVPPTMLRQSETKFSMVGLGAVIIRSQEDNLKILSYEQAEAGGKEVLFEVKL